MTPSDPPPSIGDAATVVRPRDAATPSVGPPTVPGYDLLDELGRGGMGVVYKARHAALNRTVAVKMVLGGEHTDPRELARFLAEAEVVVAVRHPNVVQVFDYGPAGGRPYLVMEYLPGGTLADRLKASPGRQAGESGRMAAREAAELVGKIARGVQAAHDQGIVHRDLKPGNVLLDAAGEPKVADFGLAKRGGRDDLTRSGAVLGTPAYMAPEQAAGRTKFAGPAADVYALGVILYELLTGRVPFRDSDVVKLLQAVAEDEPPAVRDEAPEVPRDLEAVCLKCLAKDPRARYPTAAGLADDLDRVLAGESVSARSVGLFGRLSGALDRSLKDVEFAAYGDIMIGLAGIMLAAEVVVTLIAFEMLSGSVLIPVNWARVFAFLGLMWWFRGGRLLPRTAAERQLWSLGGGYLVAVVSVSLSARLAVFGWELKADTNTYLAWAALTGLMFFGLGGLFWGRCYVLGLLFLASGFLMAADLRFAPLIFGVTWAGSLVVIGVRLRRLARAG